MRTFLVIFSILFPFILLGQNCPYATDPATKNNKIYLYFPDAANTAFPNFTGSYQVATTPLALFEANALFAAATNDLRDSIRILVANHYCEFDVGVLQTESYPTIISTATNARTNIIGIATDNHDDSNQLTFGLAQGDDPMEEDQVSHARVWAGEFKDQFGGSALDSSHGDILNRWANTIASTASHEAGHNYSLPHETLPSDINHIMASGNILDGENRATVSKYFSNTSFGVLASSLGLNVNTLHSWDLINPNNQVANQMVITVFSKATSLSIVNANVSGCPWQAPTISPIDTGYDHWLLNESYNKFELTFDQPKSWLGGDAGQVPAGGRFHIGVAFGTNEAVIVTDVKLKNGSIDLPLHPRTVGFDKGFIDISTGQASMRIFNNGIDSSRVRQLSATNQIRIENLRIDFLPRVADLKSMRNFDGSIFPTPNQEGLFDFRGLRVFPERGANQQQQNIILDTVLAVFFGKLTDPRQIDITFDSTGCIKGIVPGDVFKGQINYCPHGTLLSLFPATMIYVTATVVESNATYFDAARNEFVTGDLRTYVQYQFSGMKPDFNNNGIDDLIDIKNGTSKDSDGNGIPDEVIPELPPKPDRPMPWWFWGIIILLILIIIFILVNRNRRTGIG